MNEHHKSRAYLLGHTLRPWAGFALAAALILSVAYWRFL